MTAVEWSALEQLAAGINATRAELLDAQSKNRLNQNAFFSLSMALIIFMMQTGFAFLEAGAVRAKNCTNILAKNLLDSLLTIIGYWSVGWALAYGNNADEGTAFFVGASNFFGVGIQNYARFFFQYVFAARASTIISGAVAERCEFFTFIVYSILVSSTVYPILTHWAWSDQGWLKRGVQIGDLRPTTYLDIAGSGVVHLCGGTIALVAAFLMGPRVGRFGNAIMPKDEMFAGHSVPFAALGGFILMFGFLAFNGGAIADISGRGAGRTVALAMVNTILCGAFSALACLLIHRRRHAKWTLLLTINACLTGMIASCAGCSLIRPWAAPFIGIGASLIYLALSNLLTRLQIDDPLDAFAVHAGGGLWGLIAVCIFGRGGLTSAVFGEASFAQAFAQLGWNVWSALVIVAWSALTMMPVFALLKALGKLRVSAEVEAKGLDFFKHGESSYPLIAYGHGWNTTAPKTNHHHLATIPEAVDVVLREGSGITTVFHDPKTYGSADGTIVQLKKLEKLFDEPLQIKEQFDNLTNYFKLAGFCLYEFGHAAICLHTC